MTFAETTLKGSYIIDLNLFTDDRGAFARTFCKREFEQIGHAKEFVQFNQSYNTFKGTIRGMHYQKPPFKEIKLIRCIRGTVYDVIIDIRENSPTFLKHVGVELSAENKKMIYVPEGFAHGFVVLSDTAEFLYKTTDYYAPEYERCIVWNDNDLNINWPIKGSPVLSMKDQQGLTLRFAEVFM